MEIAVFSDIHSNYTAFLQCVKYALAQEIHTFLFLGDYLAELPYPQKTMELLYSLKEKYTCYFIKGNKEDYWINRKYDENCEWKNGNPTVGAMQYCYNNLTKKDMDFFESLPISLEIRRKDAAPILACHGSPNKNNESMHSDHESTNKILDETPYRYILCGHTHVQEAIRHNNTILLNPGSVGVPLHSGGKTQFLILRQSMQEWIWEFISLDYEKEKIIKELKESGLEAMAPYWTQITKHLLLTGTVSHAKVLARARQLCEEETGSSTWFNVPGKYWEEAIAQLLI